MKAEAKISGAIIVPWDFSFICAEAEMKAINFVPKQ